MVVLHPELETGILIRAVQKYAILEDCVVLLHIPDERNLVMIYRESGSVEKEKGLNPP